MRKVKLVLSILWAALLFIPASAIADHNTTDRHSDNIRIAGRAQFPYGTDLAFRGQTMVAGAGDWDGAYDTGVRIYHIGNPTAPKLLSYVPCNGWHTDVDIWKNLIVSSHDSASSNTGCYEGDPNAGKQGVQVIDASNLSSPRPAGFAETIHGAHNLTAIGDTGLVYVSSYSLGNPAAVDGVSIVDIHDPDNPSVRFLEFPDADNSPDYEDMQNQSGQVPTSPGCHDVGFDMDRNLAFCAGITETQIWDISDPRNPVIIEIIVNPGVNIHHGAGSNTAGNILILNDEWAGAAGGPSGCAVPQAPTGALWFYDISDPRNPVLKSYWSPPDPAPTDDFCTSHFYGVFPDRDYVATSWYDNGLYVVDFSDPSNPKQVAFYDAVGNTFWSAYAYKGYIYANSFAPATLSGSDPNNVDAGGVYVFELDGYTRSDG